MTAHTAISAEPQTETLDGFHRCEGCDKPRAGILAYCDSCEEVTRSYLFDEAPGSVTGYALTRLEQETLASLAPVVRLSSNSVIA